MSRLLTLLMTALMLTSSYRMAWTDTPVVKIFADETQTQWAVTTESGKWYEGCIRPVAGLKALCYEQSEKRK